MNKIRGLADIGNKAKRCLWYIGSKPKGKIRYCTIIIIAIGIMYALICRERDSECVWIYAIVSCNAAYIELVCMYILS
jgi:hypothetical protein